MRKLALLLVVLAALGPAFGARADGPQQVGSDPAGDWAYDVTGDNSLAPVGNATGQDLVSASIDNSTAGLVKFIIGVTNLPPTGGTPEFVRYIWMMNVDNNYVELDGKFTNYSRGTCDPTAGTCPPPRDPGSAPFFIRGNCSTVGGQVGTCQELGLVQATFDPATATITVPVPLSLLTKNPCGEILPGDDARSFPGANVVSIPSAFFSDATVQAYDEMLFDDDMDVIAC